MGDGRLSLFSENLRVQMHQAAGNRKAKFDHLLVIQNSVVQAVVERSKLEIVSNQPELSAGISRRHIRSNVAQNVLMSQQHRRVDFSFALPWLFIPAEEDFNRDILTVPNCPPHLSVASTSDALSKSDLSSESSLNQKGQAAAGAWRTRLIEVFLWKIA